MQRHLQLLFKSAEGAVAPTVALSLFALIAAGGIAFDYARMAALDTELQNAADQAALAAASQLDGDAGTCARAAAAAAHMLSNSTLFANDKSSRAINVQEESTCDAAGKIRFWQDKAKTKAATADSNAKFVEVEVDPRTASFALTPIAAAYSPRSAQMKGVALAGLGEAYCKTPPVMICNPSETGLNKNFDASSLIGKGLKLVSVGGGTGGWAPGNFGYLSSGGGSGGAPGLREALGWTTPPGNCVAADGVNTKPGATVTVTDAINTRFDIYDSNSSCPTGGSCPASINSVKDVKRPFNASGGNACKMHSQGWQLPTGYYGSGAVPSSASVELASGTTPSAMGHPRDMCHAVDSAVSGACTGPIGNGKWDRNAYFRTNYGWNSATWQAQTGLGTSPTRYQVYSWEIAKRDKLMAGRTVLGPNPAAASGSTLVSYGKPVCSPTAGYGSGTVPSATVSDRRTFPVAVVNCLQQNVKGNSTGVAVKDWIEVFLVEPSLNRARTSAGDAYVEVVRSIGASGGAGSVQVVHKSVPYLVE